MRLRFSEKPPLALVVKLTLPFVDIPRPEYLAISPEFRVILNCLSLGPPKKAPCLDGIFQLLRCLSFLVLKLG